jgi:predicted Zn-dependent peptidase
MNLRSLLLATTVLLSAAHAQKIRLPATSRHTLDNGLTVLLMEYRKVPMVHFRMVVRGGSILDSSGFEGVAEMTAGLMREGTETRTATDIANAIDFVGGSLSVSAGADYCAAVCEVLSKDAGIGLELFADVIMRPSFPREEIDRDRKQRLAALEAVKEEPRSIASIAFRKNIYGSHPYGMQSGGTRSSLDLIDRHHLVAFHTRVFTPVNAVLVVVGDFASAEMSQKIKNAFGSWERSTAPEIGVSLPARVAGRNVVVVNKSDATQTQMLFGNTGIDIKSPDYVAVIVANTIFGSGFTSRLVEELRVKRSLTYGANSSFSANLHGGSYTIATFTKNETVNETIDVVLAEIGKYRAKGATADELNKAQNYIAGSFARSLQSPGALASRLTDIELYGFRRDHLETYIQRLRAITLADVQRVAQKYFLLDDLVIVLVAPGEETSKHVQKYGATTLVELENVIE